MIMRKYVAMILVVFMVLGLAGCTKQNGGGSSEQMKKYNQISMNEAMAMMEKEEDYIILDVRTPEEFAEKHIPNAINIPNETIGTEPISELPEEDQLILVYCRSGNRSKQASEKLAEIGYTKVYEFGGINDWTGETVSE